MYVALGVLATFTGIWAGVWIFARKRGATHIIAGGGGFISACVILMLSIELWSVTTSSLTDAPSKSQNDRAAVTAAPIKQRNPHFKIVGDNQSDIARHARQKGDAEALLRSIPVLLADGVQKLQRHHETGEEVNVAAVGIRFARFREEAQAKFGTAGMDIMGRCTGFAIMAEHYWQTLRSAQNNPADPAIQRAKQSYDETLMECRHEIDQSPEPVVKLVSDVPLEKPPAEGCIGTGDGIQWTCPRKYFP